MKTSNAGISLIKQFEGCRLEVYLDPVGVPTCGYGHTAGLTKSMVGMKITQEQADAYLKVDLAKFEKKVSRYDCVYHWTQNEFDAMVSFCYNIGNIDGLTNNGKRDKSEIAAKMLSYNKAGGVVLKGLSRRRKAEYDMFLSANKSAKKSVEEVAREVIDRKWGDNPERKRRLIEAGYDYEAVRAEVNRMLM